MHEITKWLKEETSKGDIFLSIEEVENFKVSSLKLKEKVISDAYKIDTSLEKIKKYVLQKELEFIEVMEYCDLRIAELELTRVYYVQ